MRLDRSPYPPSAPTPEPPSATPSVRVAWCSGCSRSFETTLARYLAARSRCTRCPAGTWAALLPPGHKLVVPAPPPCPDPGPAGVVLSCDTCRTTWEPSYDDWQAGRTECHTCGGWTWVAALPEPAQAVRS
jgi:hypothetical protein